MADDLTVDNGSLTDFDVATDDDGSGHHVQIVKLAQAGDGSRTPIPADSDGMLVNLGANNDVTVSGVATAANQSTLIGHVDGIEGLLTTIDSVLDAIAALLGTIDADTGASATDLAAIEVLLGTIDADTGNLAAILTALQLIDNPVAVLGTATYTEATSSGMIMGAVRRDADTTLVNTTNEIAPLQVDANGRLKVEAFSGETLPVSLAALPASTNTLEVVGDAAHGAAVAGNPVLTGLEGRSTDPTAVDSGDVVRPLATLLGKQVVAPYAIPASTWQYASVSGGITDTADDAAVAAGGAGVRRYITHVDVVNAHATVGTEVVIKSASTIIWRGYAAPGGGGISIDFNVPLRGGSNEAINVTNITTGAATYFNLTGFTAAE